MALVSARTIAGPSARALASNKDDAKRCRIEAGTEGMSGGRSTMDDVARRPEGNENRILSTARPRSLRQFVALSQARRNP